MFGAWAEMIVRRGDQKSRKGKTTRKEILLNIIEDLLPHMNRLKAGYNSNNFDYYDFRFIRNEKT